MPLASYHRIPSTLPPRPWLLVRYSWCDVLVIYIYWHFAAFSEENRLAQLTADENDVREFPQNGKTIDFGIGPATGSLTVLPVRANFNSDSRVLLLLYFTDLVANLFNLFNFRSRLLHRVSSLVDYIIIAERVTVWLDRVCRSFLKSRTNCTAARNYRQIAK